MNQIERAASADMIEAQPSRQHGARNLVVMSLLGTGRLLGLAGLASAMLR